MSLQKYSTAKMLNERIMMTPWFRASFAEVFRPGKPMKDGDEPKYSVMMVFDPKYVDLTNLKKAIFMGDLNHPVCKSKVRNKITLKKKHQGAF